MNKCFELNRDFEVISERLVDYEFLNKRIDGIEDVRIFNSADGVKFIGVSEHNDKRIGVVYGNYNKENIVSNEIIPSFSNNHCEKNWVLFNDKENNLKVIYDWYPLKICRIDETKNSLELLETKTNVPSIFKKIRDLSNFKLIIA